jgi:hypothetical protein
MSAEVEKIAPVNSNRASSNLKRADLQKVVDNDKGDTKMKKPINKRKKTTKKKTVVTKVSAAVKAA